MQECWIILFLYLTINLLLIRSKTMESIVQWISAMGFPDYRLATGEKAQGRLTKMSASGVDAADSLRC